jgi:hypothetical protein
MDSLVVRLGNGASFVMDILSYLAARRCRSLQKPCDRDMYMYSMTCVGFRTIVLTLCSDQSDRWHTRLYNVVDNYSMTTVSIYWQITHTVSGEHAISIRSYKQETLGTYWES